MDSIDLLPGGFVPLRSHAAKIWLLFGLLLTALSFDVQAQVATPVLNPPSATFNTITNVKVTCSTAGAEMHYTTDGSSPDITSPVVPSSGFIVVGAYVKLRVIAFSGATASAMASGNYLVVGTLGCGQEFGLAVRFDGRKVWAWGENSYGQIGSGNTQNLNLPAQVKSSGTAGDFLQGVTMVAGGYHHSLALKGDGTVWSWGNNSSGQLGNGTTANQLYPGYVQVSGGVNLTGIIQIASVWDSSFALRGSDGSVWAWGNNNGAQMGIAASSSPVTYARQIKATSSTNFTGVVSIASGGSFAMALKNDGTVWVWGTNAQKQFGSATNASANGIYPVKVAALSNIVSIAARNGSCFAIDSSGTAWAWGDNGKGQLANGTVNSPQVPPAPMKTDANTNMTGIKTVAAGFWHTVVLKTDGTVYATGWNSTGQLAYNGSHTSSNYLVACKEKLADGTTPRITASQIAAGGNMSMAIRIDGTVYTWGANSGGQIGDGTAAIESTYAKPISTEAFPTLGNHAPAITLSLSAGPYYQTGSITLTASPSDPDAVSGITNGLGSVNFFDGTTLLGSATAYPWTFSLSNPAVGSHSIMAQAVDEVGATTMTPPVLTDVAYDPTLDTDQESPTSYSTMAYTTTKPGAGGRFSVKLPMAGRYRVYFKWTGIPGKIANRSPHVDVTVYPDTINKSMPFPTESFDERLPSPSDSAYSGDRNFASGTSITGVDAWNYVGTYDFTNPNLYPAVGIVNNIENQKGITCSVDGISFVRVTDSSISGDVVEDDPRIDDVNPNSTQTQIISNSSLPSRYYNFTGSKQANVQPLAKVGGWIVANRSLDDGFREFNAYGPTKINQVIEDRSFTHSDVTIPNTSIVDALCTVEFSRFYGPSPITFKLNVKDAGSYAIVAYLSHDEAIDKSVVTGTVTTSSGSQDFTSPVLQQGVNVLCNASVGSDENILVEIKGQICPHPASGTSGTVVYPANTDVTHVTRISDKKEKSANSADGGIYFYPATHTKFTYSIPSNLSIDMVRAVPVTH